MTEPKGLLDPALAGVKKGKIYDIELPNGVKIRTDASDAEHQRVRETLSDLAKAGAFPDLNIKTLMKGFLEPYFKRLKAVETRKRRQ